MPLFPPLNFCSIENGLYRSSLPQPINFEFIKSLNLKTIVLLSPDPIDENFLNFVSENNINLTIVAKIVKDSNPSSYTISDEVVTETLKVLIQESNYPLLVTCKSGRGLTGIFVACLRKIQRWSLISIYEEYRRYAGGTIMQQQHEQFIELFDIETLEITDNSSSYFKR